MNVLFYRGLNNLKVNCKAFAGSGSSGGGAEVKLALSNQVNCKIQTKLDCSPPFGEISFE